MTAMEEGTFLKHRSTFRCTATRTSQIQATLGTLQQIALKIASINVLRRRMVSAQQLHSIQTHRNAISRTKTLQRLEPSAVKDGLSVSGTHPRFSRWRMGAREVERRSTRRAVWVSPYIAIRRREVSTPAVMKHRIAGRIQALLKNAWNTARRWILCARGSTVTRLSVLGT